LSAADVERIITEVNEHTDAAGAEWYRRVTRGEFDGQVSPAHYPNSLANLRVMLGKALALLAEIEADLPEPEEVPDPIPAPE
jgi:hypothetical protein